jgi:hypothetical protein
MARGKNSGIIVELPDGRWGQLYHRDRKNMINGKLPIYTTEKPTAQGDLFTGFDQALAEIQAAPKRVMVDPKALILKGYFD